MNGNKYEIIREYVDSSGPTFESLMTAFSQFWIKERVESIGRTKVIIFTPLHY
jgi:hypothetical protein